VPSRASPAAPPLPSPPAGLADFGLSPLDRGAGFGYTADGGEVGGRAAPPREEILYEKSFNLKTISQGDSGPFRENSLIILSKVAKIASKIVFKLKLFPYKIGVSSSRELVHVRSVRIRSAPPSPATSVRALARPPPIGAAHPQLRGSEFRFQGSGLRVWGVPHDPVRNAPITAGRSDCVVFPVWVWV